MNEDRVKNLLEDIFTRYHRKELLHTDPLGIVHSYGQQERELVALLCALFAYGRVGPMRSTLQKLFERFENSPTQVLRERSPQEIRASCKGLIYRFYTSDDIANFLISIRKLLKKYGSLGEAFQASWDGDVRSSLASFQNQIRKNLPSENISQGLRFMISNSLVSPTKRWHMFLRWMVRKDEIDLGDWSFIPARKLLIPLDTHIFYLSKRMKLCSKATPSLKASLEITENLRRFDSEDPTRYDFSLCRVGILGKKESVFEPLKPAPKKLSRSR